MTDHTSLDVIPTTREKSPVELDASDIYNVMIAGNAYTPEELSRVTGRGAARVLKALNLLRVGRRVVLVDDSASHLTYAVADSPSPNRVK